MPRGRYAKTRMTIDGRERYCRRCSEWWPDERGFWYKLGSPNQTCKACHDEWHRQYMATNPVAVERRRAYQRERARRLRAA